MLFSRAPICDQLYPAHRIADDKCIATTPVASAPNFTVVPAGDLAKVFRASRLTALRGSGEPLLESRQVIVDVALREGGRPLRVHARP